MATSVRIEEKPVRVQAKGHGQTWVFKKPAVVLQSGAWPSDAKCR
jgi:hypothetical protein